MASTYPPSYAFDYAKRFVKNMPLEQVQPRILDDVLKIMWMAAPWRWTVGALPNVTLAANTQNYAIALPNDYLYPVEAYLTDQQGGTPRWLEIAPSLVTGGLQGQPSVVSITGAAGGTGNVRFVPQPGGIPANGWQMISLYKKIAPVITNQNWTTAGVQLFDDEWFWTYQSGVLWQAYLFADDQRAGTVQTDGQGKLQYTGQRGVFEANLQWMKEREPLLIVNGRDPVDPKRRA